MKQIPLSQGYHVSVDDERYSHLTRMGSWYYERGIATHAKTRQRMPRVVCRLVGIEPPGRILFRDGNGLNCTRYNLLLTPSERLWYRVTIKDNNTCWPWNGRVTENGYGKLSLDGKEVLAHRLSYIVTYGMPPAHLDVCHKCDNPPCCNPSHLWLGTRGDNNADRASKGRSAPVYGEHNGHAILTERDVRLILDSSETCASLGDQFGVHLSLISRIRTGKAWAHVQR